MVQNFAKGKFGTKASCSAHCLGDRLAQSSREVFILAQGLKLKSNWFHFLILVHPLWSRVPFLSVCQLFYVKNQSLKQSTSFEATEN